MNCSISLPNVSLSCNMFPLYLQEIFAAVEKRQLQVLNCQLSVFFNLEHRNNDVHTSVLLQAVSAIQTMVVQLITFWGMSPLLYSISPSVSSICCIFRLIFFVAFSKVFYKHQFEFLINKTKFQRDLKKQGIETYILTFFTVPEPKLW